MGETVEVVLSMVPPGWKKASPETLARVLQVFTFAISLRYCLIGGAKKKPRVEVSLNVFVFFFSPATTWLNV